MDAIDVSPTRLERAKLKVRDLLALRPGARTAIFAYAGSAHLVLPLTDDANLIRTYVDSLATSIMPMPGKDTAKALAVVEAGLAREEVPGTILLLTDGVEPQAFNAFSHRGKNDVMILGIGTAEGGPVKTGADSFLSDASGRRVFARLDVDALRKLKSEAGIELATVTTDDADVQWIQRRVQTHLERKQEDSGARWRDFGWYLTIPIALLGALWFRRGWTIRWTAGIILSLVLAQDARAQESHPPSPTNPWLLAIERAFFTPDQLGRRAFERGEYDAAAEFFEDPMWKGTALFRAGRFEDAVSAFARVDSAESYYDQGNALAKLGNLKGAVASYQEALKRRPDFVDAEANLALVQKLIKKEADEEQEAQDPAEKPDQVQFDDKGKKGKAGQVDLAAQTAEMWMRNIQTTPAQLLQHKFALQAQAQKR
jgi:Ca-activated chloride channel family protein